MISVIALASRRATIQLAQKLAPLLTPGCLILLSGEVGAGKTFFTRALGRALGIEPRTRIVSPTYNLLSEYETSRGLFVHVDLYRLRDGNTVTEIARLGLREMRGEGAMMVVEWADGVEDAFGKEPDLQLFFSRTAASGRTVIASGPLRDALLGHS